MCGLVGYWSDKPAAAVIAEQMSKRISYRGPDDSGVWVDKHACLAMAHRRLSILDLSRAGHQPMQSPCGRYTLVYNGEIYNHLELRLELEAEGGAFEWRSHSDTETLLAGLRHWGIEAALQKLNGMFAFALWDSRECLLYLARDRMGEKPLYYGTSAGTFLFGSELKALKAHPDWSCRVSREALSLYLRHNYVPAPWSIYEGIWKLPPAHYVVVSENGNNRSAPVCYWNLSSIVEEAGKGEVCEPEALTAALDDLLRDSILRRMASDVPLGAFLSGGIDSTVVAAIMQSQSMLPIKTFTIGFSEKKYNEANYAKVVAKYLNTEHTELYVTPGDALKVIPRLPTIYDEPFSDSSQIPTVLVSKLARQHVTVSLSGDGGDELFFGYSRYFLAQRLWKKLQVIPPLLRRTLASIMMSVPGSLLNAAQNLLPLSRQIPNIADRIPKLAEILSQSTRESFYRDLVSHQKHPDRIVLNVHEPMTVLNNVEMHPKVTDIRKLMMYLDMKTYLPDDILTKMDRASMSVGLEARVPLLDHRLVEFSWRVPIDYKYRDGEGKWLLRQVLQRYIPKNMTDRPKMGFGVPIEEWLRGPLREWGEDLLDERVLREDGFFDPSPIRKMWREHMSGTRRWHYYLWDVLMFQAWLKEN